MEIREKQNGKHRKTEMFIEVERKLLANKDSMGCKGVSDVFCLNKRYPVKKLNL